MKNNSKRRRYTNVRLESEIEELALVAYVFGLGIGGSVAERLQIAVHLERATHHSTARSEFTLGDENSVRSAYCLGRLSPACVRVLLLIQNLGHMCDKEGAERKWLFTWHATRRGVQRRLTTKCG